MKKIIVPTDFSPASANAYIYARAFAAVTERPLKVVHITYPGTYIDTSLPKIPDNTLNTKERKLDQFVSQWENSDADEKSTKVVVEQQVIFGAATEELVKLSKEKDSDFIIMGTTGIKGPLNNFLGTVSSNVSQKAHCPVWLIPPGISFNSINDILYTGNYESANKTMFDAILNIADTFDSIIHLVHINNPKINKGDWRFEELVLEELFRKKVTDFPIDLHTVQSESFWEGINDYVENRSIDLIVMVTHHRDLWTRLLHKSMTKTMVLHTKTPLLILHLEDAVLK